jgi:hypothetical protein
MKSNFVLQLKLVQPTVKFFSCLMTLQMLEAMTTSGRPEVQ